MKLVVCCAVALTACLGAMAVAGEVQFLPSDRKMNPTPEGSELSSHPHVCASSQGAVYVFWGERGHVRMNRSLDFGATWEDGDRVVSAESGSAPIAWCDEEGRVLVMFRSTRDGHATPAQLFLNASDDYGSTWLEQDVAVSHIPWWADASPRDEGMSSDEDGNVYAWWNGHRTSAYDFEIYFNHSTDFGATWQPNDLRLDQTDPDHESVGVDVCHDEAGNVYVAWLDRPPSGPESLQIQVSRDHGDTWLPSPVALDWAAEISYIVVRCDEDGRVYLTYAKREQPEAPRHVYLRSSQNYGATWSTDIICVSCADNKGDLTAMANDDVGRVYVIYRASVDGPAFRLAISEDYGRTFADSITITDPGAFLSPTSLPHIRATAAGHVTVVFEDDRVPTSVTSVFATYSTDYGQTWSTDQRLDTGSYIASQSAMTMDRQGDFYAVWTDWRTDAFRGDIYLNRGRPAVGLGLRGASWPVVVSPGGGVVDFDVTVANRTSNDLIGVPAFIDGEVRPGRNKGPLLGPVSIDLLAGSTRTKSVSRSIPPGLPPGLYHLRLNLGPSVADRAVLPIRVKQ